MEKNINLIVKSAENNLRVDVFINKREKIISRTRIKNLILKKKLKLNNEIIISPSKKVFTGDKISAIEAEELNMIYKCISEEEFEDFILKIAEKMALMPTRAFGLTKKAVNQSLDNTLEEQLNLEEKLQTEAGKTEDFQEGVQAFLEKRKAKFKGK